MNSHDDEYRCRQEYIARLTTDYSIVEISNVWFSKVYSKLDENMAARIKTLIC